MLVLGEEGGYHMNWALGDGCGMKTGGPKGRRLYWRLAGGHGHGHGHHTFASTTILIYLTRPAGPYHTTS
jgi:hypothetical protein